MWFWLDRIGTILFDAGFATAVFSTLIVLAMLGCRQPARRILLARVSLLASLAIIPLVAWGHLPRLYVVDTFVESPFFPRALFLAAAALEPTGPPGAGEPVATEGPGRFVPVWLLERVDAGRRWLPRGLTMLDLACVAVGTAWLVLGIGGVQWLIRRSRPPSPEARALFEGLMAAEARGPVRIGLRVCSRLRHPVVSGLFRPVILIPEALDRVDDDPEPLRLSLLHELAHAERWDHWFSTAASVSQSIWFFLPQIWWIRSRLLIDQEFLADRAAAQRYGTSSAYASSLLSLAAPGHPAGRDEPEPEPARPGGASETIGVQSPLFQRMMMLLHCPYPLESRTPRVWSWTSRFAVILGSIAAACLVIRWPQATFAVPAPAPAGAPRPRFQAPHFVTEPLLDVDGRLRSRVYVLPFTLPRRYDLDLDARCQAAGPVGIRLVGQSIEIPGLPDDPGVAEFFPPSLVGDDTSEWHHVHLHRDARGLTIEVDGRSVPPSGDNGSAREWLTIEPPPSSPVEFRNLVVTW